MTRQVPQYKWPNQLHVPGSDDHVGIPDFRPIGERHFRRAVKEYVEHYHGEQNHQGLDNRLITGPPVIETTRRVQRRSRLGGLLNFYRRAA